MDNSHNRQRDQSLLVSGISEDGTIVETVYSARTRQTAFVIARSGDIQVAPNWTECDAFCVPVRASNNLLKHQALLFAEEASDYADTDALLGEIEKYIRRYVALSAEAIAISIAYVLLSWVYDAFNELPYLRYRGDHGCGKSRALLVVGSLCYKPFFASGASSVSPIFHTLDTFRGTLVFDEADFRFTDEKAELVKILNNGNSKGFPVLRTQVTQKREFDPRAFIIFGPKIVGMRRSYEDKALESRFLTIEMEPGCAAGVPINLPDGQKEEALALRNKLLMYRLRNRASANIDAALTDHNLEPRMNQILLPLLSVAPNEGLRDAIRSMARGLQAGIVADRSISTEGQVLAIVATKAIARDRPASLAEITDEFARQHRGEYERPIVNRWIGSVVRRLGLTLYKSNGVSVLLPGQEERISALCRRYGVEALGHSEPRQPRELGR